MNKQLYSYYGPVMEFDRIVDHRWKGETYASSENKAKSNLAYQYKNSHGKLPCSKITLPGKLIKGGADGYK